MPNATAMVEEGRANGQMMRGNQRPTSEGQADQALQQVAPGGTGPTM